MAEKIALASSTGIFVDEHFAQATAFYIYSKSADKFIFEEKRICRCPVGHDTNAFDAIIELLSDCEAIFVNKIGAGAAHYLIEKGKRVFDAPYPVETVLEQVIKKDLLADTKA
jgi:predicted Fe-Mo cluster-binding NifX family protein